MGWLNTIKGWFSERHIGYLFILPAVLIILTIAIWPVIRTFWISLYDVQLNDPSKNATYLDYGLAMDNFVEQYPILTNLIDQSIKNPKNKNSTQQLQQVKTQIINLKNKLDQNPNFQKHYDQIDDLLYNDAPVPSDLTSFPIDKTKALQTKQQLTSISNKLKQISFDPIQKKNSLGLLTGLQKTIIQPNFIGLGHYIDIFQESRFWNSLWNTTFFTIISVLVEFVIGLAIALLINRQFRGRGIVRASVLVPWAIPTVVSALMWKFMFDGQNGVLAKLLEKMGVVSDMGLLLTTKTGSMFAVIFADVWKTAPFITLLLLAGLQTIPSALYEAAHVDGASKIQQFFRITLPLLKPAILVTLLFRTLDAFRIFDLVYVLTGGGPANATETISILTYKTMFAQMNFGEGSALSVIAFICIAIISIFYIRFLGTNLLNESQSN